MKFTAVLICILATATTAYSATLETSSHIINITQNCAEGEVTCEKVTYYGVSKQTGAETTLTGKTMHTTTTDGSPGRFLGYKFKNGDTTYIVLESGTFEVIQNKSEVISSEVGVWKN